MRLQPALRGTRRARLRRRIHLLPHLFTIGNLFAGYFALSAVLAGDLDRASMAIVIGWVLDTLDGSVARLVQTSSRIGVQLDSMADIVTFGIAPAFLALVWGSSAIDAPDPRWEAHLHRLAWIASFAFVAAGALRLARFNVMSADDTVVRPRADAFVGMPIPAGALCVAVVVHLVKEPLLAWSHAVVWLVYLLSLAGLMVSRVRFPHFRRLLTNPRHPQLLMLILALLLAGMYSYSEIVAFGLLVAYLCSVAASNLRRPGPGGPLNGPPGEDV
jgi:CDP-diacylglycerol--serine O-phosphatidyltransferase